VGIFLSSALIIGANNGRAMRAEQLFY
jgi:hypothetical protein